MKKLLTAENWKKTVRRAVAALREDIQSSIGLFEDDKDSIRLTISVGDGDVTTVEVRYWEFAADLAEACKAEPQGQVRDGYIVGRWIHIVIEPEQACWPIVEVSGRFGRSGYFVDRAPREQLRRHVMHEIIAIMRGKGLID